MKSLTPLHALLAFDNAVKELAIEAIDEMVLWTDQDVWLRLDGVDPTAAAPAIKLTAASSPLKLKVGHAASSLKALRAGGSDGTLTVYGYRTVSE